LQTHQLRKPPLQKLVLHKLVLQKLPVQKFALRKVVKPYSKPTRLIIMAGLPQKAAMMLMPAFLLRRSPWPPPGMVLTQVMRLVKQLMLSLAACMRRWCALLMRLP